MMSDLKSEPIDFDGAEHQAKLAELYRDFGNAGLTPLWQVRGNLQPFSPESRAVPHRWRWAELYPIAARSAELVPVGRGGERRAIGLGNPGLPGDPFATPTLWAAIQYLAPRENAPEHRHSQTAFRFVLEGEGVWTVVDGDPVAMRRGDLLLTPGWRFHGHQNVSDAPMAWLDGLDIPFVGQLDQGFFEFGPEVVRDPSTPERSRSERLCGDAAGNRQDVGAVAVGQAHPGQQRRHAERADERGDLKPLDDQPVGQPDHGAGRDREHDRDFHPEVVVGGQAGQQDVGERDVGPDREVDRVRQQRDQHGQAADDHRRLLIGRHAHVGPGRELIRLHHGEDHEDEGEKTKQRGRPASLSPGGTIY